MCFRTVTPCDPLLYSVGLSPAPLHTCGPAIKRPNRWSFYSSMEEVDQLIEALNPRGLRESSLKEALQQERERLQHVLQNCDHSKYSCTGTHTGVHTQVYTHGCMPIKTTILSVQITLSRPDLSQNAVLQLRLLWR